MRTRAAVLLSAVVLATALTPVGAGAAAAAPTVTCGVTLEEDAFLTKDLHCRAGTGIYLDLGVTLDLRGFRIIGPGVNSTAGNGIGVRLAPTSPSKVINGVITGWPVAIGGNEDFETHQTATLQKLNLTGNGTAVLANQSVLTLDGLIVRDNTIGLHARSWGETGTRFTLTNSAFRGNDVAVTVDRRTVATLTNNTFRENDTGYTVEDGFFTEGYSVRLTGNLFQSNGDGVKVDYPGTELGGNTSTYNTGWGIYAPGATDLGGNVARKNGNTPQCVGVVCATR